MTNSSSATCSMDVADSCQRRARQGDSLVFLSSSTKSWLARAT